MKNVSGLSHAIGNLAPLTSGLVTAPFTARALGVEDRGNLAVVLTGYAFVFIVGTFGLGWSARHALTARQESPLAWYRLALKYSLLYLPATMAVAAGVSYFLGLTTQQFAAVVIYYGLCAFSSVLSVQMSVLVAMNKPGTMGAISIASTIFLVLSVVALALLNLLTLLTMLIINITAVGIVVLLSRLTTQEFMHANGQEGHRRPRRRGVRSRSSRRAWYGQVLDTVASRIDVLIVSAFGSSFLLGQYSVLTVLPGAAYALFQTLVQRSYALQPQEDSDVRLGLLMSATIPIGAACATAGCLTAWTFIPLYFGEEFAYSRGLLPVVALAIMGLAFIVPILQHAAVTPRASSRGLASVVLPIIAACVVGMIFPGQPALYTLAAANILTGVLYIGSTIGMSALFSAPSTGFHHLGLPALRTRERMGT